MEPIGIIAFLLIIVVILIVTMLMKSDYSPITSKKTYNTSNSFIDNVYQHSNNSMNQSRAQYDSKVDDVFSNVIDFLKSNDVYFRYGINKKEKDYQQDLDQKLDFLKYKYGYEKIYEGRQEKQRIDFVINGNIGIEMKVYRGGSQVKKELFYQISEYGKFCEKMVAFIINLTKEDNSEIERDIRLKLEEVINRNDLEVIVKYTNNQNQ